MSRFYKQFGVLLSIGLFFFSCREGNDPHQEVFKIQRNKVIVDSCVELLRTGDLVLRLGNGPISSMIVNANTEDKEYSHCGMVVVENGCPFVYHILDNGKDNAMQRDSATHWYNPQHNLRIGAYRYQLDTTEVNAIIADIKVQYNRGKAFDLDFDLNSEDKYYCSEFIYKCINHALADSIFIQPTVVDGHTYIALDDLYLNTKAKPVCRIRF